MQKGGYFAILALFCQIREEEAGPTKQKHPVRKSALAYE